MSILQSHNLDKREINLFGTLIPCWVLKLKFEDGSIKYFYKGNDIASFIGCKSPKDSIRRVKSIYKMRWIEIVESLPPSVFIETPFNWNSNSIFLTESGIYDFFIITKLEGTEFFHDWLFNRVVPMMSASIHSSLNDM